MRERLLAWLDHCQIVAEQHGDWDWARYYATHYRMRSGQIPRGRVPIPANRLTPVYIPAF